MESCCEAFEKAPFFSALGITLLSPSMEAAEPAFLQILSFQLLAIEINLNSQVPSTSGSGLHMSTQ